MGWKTDNVPSTKGLSKEEASRVDTPGLYEASGGVKPPDDPPDATDAVIRQRRAAEMNRLMLGFGRNSTFTEGGMGDLRLGRKSLTGGG